MPVRETTDICIHDISRIGNKKIKDEKDSQEIFERKTNVIINLHVSCINKFILNVSLIK